MWFASIRKTQRSDEIPYLLFQAANGAEAADRPQTNGPSPKPASEQ